MTKYHDRFVKDVENLSKNDDIETYKGQSNFINITI